MPGELTIMIAIMIAIALCLFPVGYVWYLTLPGWKFMRAAEEAKRKTTVVKDLEVEGTRTERVGVAALFFLVAILLPLLIWVAFAIAIRRPLIRAVRRGAAVLLAFLEPVPTLLALLPGFIISAVGRTASVVSVRGMLLRGARWGGAVLLALLAAVLVPAIIWVLNGVAIWQLLLRWRQGRAVTKAAIVRQVRSAVAAVLLAPVLVVLSPLLIGVQAFFALSTLYRQWRESQLPSGLVCGIDQDCPPGYMCVDGRCVPRY